MLGATRPEGVRDMATSGSIKRVGMLFSGGPAPAANAVISAAALSFINAGVEVIGFFNGYERLERFTPETPLVEGRDYTVVTRDDVAGIRSDGAIYLRTARANPGKPVKSFDDLADSEKNAKLRAVFGAFEQLKIDALVSIGGDDTLKTGNYILRIQDVVEGLRPVRVVHLPKTIDNDYFGIDWTFGFMSAAEFVASEIRNLVADAKSGNVWYVLEVMGRKAGWLTYAAGIAGGAHKMLSVEDFDVVFDLNVASDQLASLVEQRQADNRAYGVICIAEGLADMLPSDQRPKDVDEHGNAVLGSTMICRMLAEATEKRFAEKTGGSVKVRHKQVGYEARCTRPTAYDVILGSELGVGACRALVDEGLNGVMVSVEGQFDLRYVPFAELIDPNTLLTKLRFIERDSDFYRLARALEYR